MGHGHQPSVPTSEAYETGEVEHQLDWPSLHADKAIERSGALRDDPRGRRPLLADECHLARPAPTGPEGPVRLE